MESPFSKSFFPAAIGRELMKRPIMESGWFAQIAPTMFRLSDFIFEAQKESSSAKAIQFSRPDNFHTDFSAAMTGSRDARMAGSKLPITPTTTAKMIPFAASHGVMRN